MRTIGYQLEPLEVGAHSERIAIDTDTKANQADFALVLLDISFCHLHWWHFYEQYDAIFMNQTVGRLLIH